MNIYSYLIKIKSLIFDIILPIKCFNCGVKDEIFCENCVEKVGNVQEALSDNMFAVFDYKDPIIKKAIWDLKYHHKFLLGKKLGQLLYQFLIEDISDIRTMSQGQNIFVIPVPISKKRFSTRGYNQSEIIAKGFCLSCEENILDFRNDIIYKKIETIPQAKILNRKIRLKNVQNVFTIEKSKIIKGKTILVVDDVITTGATINEIIKILKKAGAKKVIGIAMAH